MPYPKDLIAGDTSDDMDAWMSWNASHGIRVSVPVVDGPKSAIGRRVVITFTSDTLRDMLRFAEKCEEDRRSGGSGWAMTKG